MEQRNKIYYSNEQQPLPPPKQPPPPTTTTSMSHGVQPDGLKQLPQIVFMHNPSPSPAFSASPCSPSNPIDLIMARFASRGKFGFYVIGEPSGEFSLLFGLGGLSDEPSSTFELRGEGGRALCSTALALQGMEECWAESGCSDLVTGSLTHMYDVKPVSPPGRGTCRSVAESI